MSTTASRRASRGRVVPIMLLAFLLVLVGLGGAPSAALATDAVGTAPLADDESGDQPAEDEEPAPSPTAPSEEQQEDTPVEKVPSDSNPSTPPHSAPAVPAPQTSAPAPQAEIPVPDGQSNQPAPPSKEKRVLEDVHTDAVSAYLEDGKLVAATKADVDGEIGKRLKTEELLFHLSDAGKDHIRDAQDRWAFIGNVGDDYWLAPEVQETGVIWPGFSTEDPNLQEGGVRAVDVRLKNVDGPGRVELAAGAPRGGLDRLFSSEEDLGAWRLNVPRHVHAFWAFTEPGTYTLTFELTANGEKAENDYTFVVGDLAAHTQDTAVSIEASSRSVEQSEPVLFTANVDPAGAEGAMQFRDLASGTVLGHTPVIDGQAQFRADALNPGERRIIAEFVPTWGTDFQASNSSSANVTVAGEEQQKPTEDDTTPVPDSQIRAHTPGTEIVVTGDKQVVTGYPVTARATDPQHAGRWLSVWLPGQNPAWRGWVQADQNGNFSINLQGATTGSQRLVVKDAEGGFVGYDAFEVVRQPGPGGGGGGNNGGGGGGSNTGGGGGGNTGGGSGGNRAPAQDCRPEMTLDHGHIDAFYVSAANGTAVMQLMEDVTGHHVLRPPETTLLKVKESALGTVHNAPAGVPNRGYWLPLSQDMDLIWPGWDTNTTRPSGHTDVSINVTGVDGPGTVSLFTDDRWGGKKPLLNGGRYNFPGTIRVPEPAHTHAHWVFSEKGIYKLTANAVATNPSNGKKLQTATHTYVFQVGDVPLGDAFCGLSAQNTDEAAAVNAAVDEHAAEALAAAQSASESDDDKKRKALTAGSAAGAGNGGSGGFLDDLFGGDGPSPALLAGLLGLGGGLALAGIAGGTIWYVLRLKRVTPGALIPNGAVSAV